MKNAEELRIMALYRHPEHTLAWRLLESFVYPWEALGSVASFVRSLGEELPETLYERRGEDIWVAKSAKIEPTAFLGGPCIVCEGAEIRHCAFVRGSALIGAGAVVGNSTELKNAILFDGVQVPHFNYVGDSILGYKAHLGAGAITSNVKSDKTAVRVAIGGARMESGCRKFGAMLGDFVEVGCNSVLNPGTVIGCGSTVYPLSSVRGFVPANHIYKAQDRIVEKQSVGGNA